MTHKFIPCKKEPKFFMPHFPIFTGNIAPVDNLNVRRILAEFGEPQKKLQNVIHVVGTNGKGSTCAFLSSILREGGFKVNTYTSPHLYACNERININAKQISDEDLFYFSEKVKQACEKLEIYPTIFESLTIVAILAFENAGGDYNIFEAGMGGMHDATNVFDGNICGVILTSISYDHTRFLGKTLPEIAKQKLGVIAEGRPIVMHPFSGEILPVILEEIAGKKATPIFFGRDWNFGKAELLEGCIKIVFQYKEEEQILLEMPPLIGDHQIYNLCAVIAFLYANGILIETEIINKGIVQTKWAGRLERVEEDTFLKLLPSGSEIWFDGAHNPGGASCLAKWMLDLEEMQNILVISKTKNTEVAEFIAPFAGLVQIGIALDSRGEIYPESTKVLEAGFRKNNIRSFEAKTFLDAIHVIHSQASARVRIIVCGSLYIARELSFSLYAN